MRICLAFLTAWQSGTLSRGAEKHDNKVRGRAEVHRLWPCRSKLGGQNGAAPHQPADVEQSEDSGKSVGSAHAPTLHALGWGEVSTSESTGIMEGSAKVAIV